MRYSEATANRDLAATVRMTVQHSKPARSPRRWTGPVVLSFLGLGALALGAMVAELAFRFVL